MCCNCYALYVAYAMIYLFNIMLVIKILYKFKYGSFLKQQ
jgi:hypothetical protein